MHTKYAQDFQSIKNILVIILKPIALMRYSAYQHQSHFACVLLGIEPHYYEVLALSTLYRAFSSKSSRTHLIRRVNENSLPFPTAFVGLGHDHLSF